MHFEDVIYREWLNVYYTVCGGWFGRRDEFWIGHKFKESAVHSVGFLTNDLNIQLWMTISFIKKKKKNCGCEKCNEMKPLQVAVEQHHTSYSYQLR